MTDRPPLQVPDILIPARNRRRNPDREVTLEELREAHAKAARIVRNFGVEFLPVFERLHKELITREQQNDLHALALSVAASTDTPQQQGDLSL